MLALSDFRTKAKGLPDLLTYAGLIDPGIILQKDGSFLAGWEVRGRDTDSSTHEELNYVAVQFNNAVKSLGTGWMLHVSAARNTQQAYPHASMSRFPDPVTQAIDDERRAFFGQDVCYSTSTTVIVTYKPRFMKHTGGAVTLKNLNYFKTVLAELEDALASILTLVRLTEYTVEDDAGRAVYSELLSYLESFISGELHRIRVPRTPMYLDAVLGNQDFIGGIEPKIGDKHIAVISIDGLPQESWPAMLSALDALPFEYRYTTRYICLSQYDATREITTYVKGWNQQVFRFFDQFFNNPNARANRDALAMREDAEEAKAEVQSGTVSAGYLSSCVVIMHTSKETLDDYARELRRVIQSIGFGCRKESINAVEAWLGSLPGNSYANQRRPLINSLNLADLLPLSTTWTGQPVCQNPRFPKNSRCLAVVTTDGSTPFWFDLFVDDVGHTLIFGPTGAGKSTLLGLIAAQFRCYQGAKIFAFDKGMSLFPLCAGAGGDHYDVGHGDLAFAPLQYLDSDTDVSWAEEWIASLMELQSVQVLPAHKRAIHDAMMLLRDQPPHMRSLSHFRHIVPHIEVKEAIAHYTTEGAMGHLLDAQTDSLGMSSFMVFEIEELMKMGDQNLLPVIMYIFHRIESALDGSPALLILDEAWVMLGHPVFRAKIREWLKVLRKANCAVVLATQSLSDARHSGILDVLVESCPTKILLPNISANQETQRDLYTDIGLNSRQIDIVATSTQKRDYYIITPEGRRLVQLALGKKTLRWIGSSDKKSINHIKEIIGNKDWRNTWEEI